jgi:hypothetical protein
VIRLVGADAFEEWREIAPERTMQQLLKDFNITQEQIREVMNNDEWYQLMVDGGVFDGASTES